jgi:pimeloyl-ACP methyl ester carboxylesterase
MGPPTREELTMSVSLHVVDEGAGPPVVLLHGFPDSSALWRHQIPALVEAGYRVIAPDLRGFGASDRPADVDAYRLEASVADVLAILDQRGIERADVVGHDWGAALGWALAGFVPDRVRSLVAVSVGHPAGYFTDTLRQREMSWYILFFLPPGVAEEALPRDGWTLLRTWLAGQGGDLDRYVADLSRPGALTAALNWYRANLTPESFGMAVPLPLPPVACPVLGVSSDHDVACGEAQMMASRDHVTGPWRHHQIAGAGHWIPLAAPDELGKLIIDHLRGDLP